MDWLFIPLFSVFNNILNKNWKMPRITKCVELSQDVHLNGCLQPVTRLRRYKPERTKLEYPLMPEPCLYHVDGCNSTFQDGRTINIAKLFEG